MGIRCVLINLVLALCADVEVYRAVSLHVLL